MSDAVLALSSGIVGAIVATMLQVWLTSRHENRLLKLDTLRRIAGWRFVIAEGQLGTQDPREFFEALNEVAVVFHHSPRIVAAVERMVEFKQGENSENLIELLEAMTSDLGIAKGALSKKLLVTPLTPPSGSRRRT